MRCARMVWILRRHYNAGRGMMIACSSTKSRCTEDYMVMLGFNGCWLQAHLAQTVNCKLQSCQFLAGAFKILPHWTFLLIDFGSHNSFSNTSFGELNIQLVRIQFSLHSKYWKLRPPCVSAVHRWVAVAGHLAESQGRICLLRFLLLTSSSFDRAQTCRR